MQEFGSFDPLGLQPFFFSRLHNIFDIRLETRFSVFPSEQALEATANTASNRFNTWRKRNNEQVFMNLCWEHVSSDENFLGYCVESNLTEINLKLAFIVKGIWLKRNFQEKTFESKTEAEIFSLFFLFEFTESFFLLFFTLWISRKILFFVLWKNILDDVNSFVG